jgi:hypothetical protein
MTRPSTKINDAHTFPSNLHLAELVSSRQRRGGGRLEHTSFPGWDPLVSTSVSVCLSHILLDDAAEADHPALPLTLTHPSARSGQPVHPYNVHRIALTPSS